MQSFLFLRGLGIGFALAAPVGPVGILCIRRALAQGRTAALAVGLGAALADSFFGAVAGLGITIVSSFLLSHQTIIRVLGGLFMIMVAIRTWRDPNCDRADPISGGNLFKDLVSTFLLTLSNPATVIAALGVFAAMGAIGIDNIAAAWVLILGVFLGSTLWWVILSTAAGAMRSRFSPQRLKWLNHASSLMLGFAGGAIMLTVLAGYFFR